MSVSTKALTIAILFSFISGCSIITGIRSSGDEATSTQVASSELTTSTGSGDSSDTVIATNINTTNQDESSDQIRTDTSEETQVLGGNQGSDSGTDISRSVQSASAANNISVDSIRFAKTNTSSGEIEITLSSEAAYVFEQTASNEYVLRIPGARVAESASSAQVAPPGFPGIRAVRVGDNESDAEIRMFVDSGSELVAYNRGNVVSISGLENTSKIANRSESRAQLKAGNKEIKVEAPPESKEQSAQDAVAAIKSSDGSRVYTGRLISLDLQDTDIDNALRIIAEVSQLNIIAAEDVKGKITLRLIDVPWDQALDVILKTNGLDRVQEGTVIRIAPVDKLRAEREALLEAKQAAEALEDLSVKYIRVSYARAADVKEQVQSVLTERGTAVTDDRTNQVIIRDVEKGQAAAAELLGRLDLRTPQILLETQIVEATKGLVRSLGFQWNYNFAMASKYGNATGMNFPSSVEVGGSSPDASGGTWASSFPAVDGSGAITAILDSADGARSLSARLSAFESEGLVKVISRPQVATVNNKQAKIDATEVMRIRLPDSGLSVATGQGAAASGGSDKAVEEIKVGIELTVTPQASPDYYVLLDLNAKSSTFGAEKVDGIPNTIERSATSTVLVKSGQTFALGGVYRINDSDTVEGLPFLKDIPFLGHMFRSSLVEKKDEELIFFITPHIVEGSFEKGSL